MICETNKTNSYPELYLSTDPSSPYYFGDKSITIHTSNTTRLTCANFMMMTNGSSSSSGAGSSTGSSTGAGISPSAIQVAGASKKDFGVAAVCMMAAGLVAALL